MDAIDAEGRLNAVLYPADYLHNLTDEAAVARLADGMIDGRYFASPVEELAESARYFAQAGHLPGPADRWSRRFSEAELVDFLRRLTRQLDARRPWPGPVFTQVDSGEWGDLARARPIGRLVMPEYQLSGVLRSSFVPVPAASGTVPAVVLRLRSGETVSLVGTSDRRAGEWTLSLLDGGEPASALAHFCELAGFEPGKVVPVAG